MFDERPGDRPPTRRVVTARYDTLELLAALQVERAKNRKLRRKLRDAEASRDEWKRKASGVAWSGRMARRRARSHGESHAATFEQTYNGANCSTAQEP